MRKVWKVFLMNVVNFIVLDKCISYTYISKISKKEDKLGLSWAKLSTRLAS